MTSATKNDYAIWFAVCSTPSSLSSVLPPELAGAIPLIDWFQISSRNLDRVRKLKSQMTRLTARVQKVRDELEQLLDDDDDMADLYLSRKLGSASPLSNSGCANWFPTSPTMDPKISRASQASMATSRGEEMMFRILKCYSRLILCKLLVQSTN